MPSDRALLVAAGGGIGDTLLAGVVAHALRSRFAHVDALVLPEHRSVAEHDASEQRAREATIEAKVRAHPAVRNVMKVLGGQLEHIQVLEKTVPKPTGEAVEEDDEPR